MPPQITFVKVSNEVSIPVKVFTKAVSSSTKSSLAINSKSLITLNNRASYFQLKLSNNYLNNLINSIVKRNLVEMLFETPVLELVNLKEYVSRSNIVSKTFENDNIKYVVVVPLILITSLRLHFSRLTAADLECLRNKKIDVTKQIKHSQISLLMREMEFAPAILEEEEESVDAKKLFKYHLQKIGIFSDLANSVKLHLLKH